MTDRNLRSIVAPRTTLTLVIALAATLALAVPPAAAQQDGAAQDGDSRQDGAQDGDSRQDGAQDGDSRQDGAQDGDSRQDGAQDGDSRQDGAQDGDSPRDGPERRGNPVEHCLPEQARDGDDSGPGAPETDTARAPETDTAGTPETDTAGTPETDTAGAPETGTARSEVAECVQDALPDIARNTHANSIVSVVIERIAQGHPDGTFRPQNPVNRAQMSTFLTRALDLEAPEGEVDAPDVDGDHPHAEGVAAVIDSGIAVGKADGSFGPGEPVSRGQMATFLTRALDLTAEDGEVPEDAAGSAHEEAISAVMEAEIAEGFPDGSFQPPAPVTRGQMATFLARGLGLESS